MTTVKADEPGGAPKGFSPGPGTGYGFSALITLATPNPVSRKPTPTPSSAGHRLHRPVSAHPRVAYAGSRAEAAIAVGASRPMRSARPDTPVATWVQNAVPSYAMSLCILHPSRNPAVGAMASDQRLLPPLSGGSSRPNGSRSISATELM